MNSALRGSTARAVAVATVVVAIAALLLGVMANALGSAAPTTADASPSATSPPRPEAAPPGGAPPDVAGGPASPMPPAQGAGSPGGDAAAAPQRYVVVEGDTLATIAGRSGVPLELIARDNGLTDPDRLSVGQELTLSAPPSNVAVIVPGSTLSDYATQLSTTVDELVALNPQIRDADVVVAGSGLRIAPV